jgi:threonine synthase
MEYHLKCYDCGSVYGADAAFARCKRCGSILEVKYDYATLGLPKGFESQKPRHRKYLPFYPVKKLVSLGEGESGLVRAGYIGIPADEVNLFLKVETGNPTGSFKDRGSSVEIAKAKELGFGEVCCASTGNMGLSIATYADYAGMKCTVFISRNGNREKIHRIRKAGAKIVLVDGDFNKSIETAERFAARGGLFLCGDYHYRKEGQKSVGFEIIDQSKKTPDYVFVPVGNGTLLASVYKSFLEYRRMGILGKMPKLVAVQSMQCDPFVSAFKEGREIRHIKPRTKADAIAVGFPTFGFEALTAVRKTGGDATAVHDNAILWVSQKLKKHMGIGSELGGAAALAGFFEMRGDDMRRFDGKTVVAVITGDN